MAVIFFVKKKKLNENAKLPITSFEHEFFITTPIETSEWPLAFSEYIVDKITDNTPSNAYLGITIKHCEGSGHIPFMSLVRLTPTVFDDHFEKIFYRAEKLSGTLKIEVSRVSIPRMLSSMKTLGVH